MQRPNPEDITFSDILSTEGLSYALISNLPGGAAFVVDRELRYVLAEGEALAIAGFKPEDFIGRTIFEALPPELAASYEPMYRQALAGEPFEDEHHAHGYTYISRGTPLRAEDGEIYAVLVVSYDISERKRVEVALRESEARLQAITNLVPDLLWDSEPDGSTNWYNQRWLEYTGQTFEQAIGWGWTDAIHPDDQEGSARRYQEAVEQGMPLRQEHRIRRHDGSYRWFVVKASPLKDERGKVIKMYGAATDIHKQRIALEALRESEEKFRTLANTAPALIWFNDAQGNNRFINQHFLDFTGKSAERIRGEGWQELVHPDDAENYIADYLAAVREQRSWHNRNRIRRHDGVWRWHDNYAQPLFDADGVYLGHVGVTIDNTEAIAAEIALQESEQRYRNLVELTPHLVWNADEQGRNTYVSSHMSEYIGLPAEQLLDFGWQTRVHPEDVDQVHRTWMEAVQTDMPYEAEYRLRRADGEYRWHLVRAVFEGNGQGRKWFGVSTDIHDRKRAEVALRESEEKYRSLFQSMDEGYAVVRVLADDNGEWNDFLFLEVNPAFEQQTGMVNSAGRKATEILGTPNPAWAKIYGRVAETGEPVRFEENEATLDRIFDLYAFRLGEAGSRRVAVLFTDITDRKRAEETLRENEARQTFLLKLGDILQQFVQPNDIKAAAMRLLGEHLGVSRAQYHECDSSGEYYSADGVGYANGLPLLDLKYRIDAFGTFVNEDFAAGRPYRIDDLEVDPRVSAEERDAYRTYQIRAGAGVPLIRGGKLVAILAIHDVHPHPWTDLEMDLIRETAERIWTPLERARAEAALRESEAKYRSLFDSIDAGFCIFEMVYNEAGEAIDFRYIETNPAFERQSGRRPQPGQTMRELFPEAKDMWLHDYAEVARTGQAKRFIDFHQELDRWFDVFVFPTSNGKNQLAALFSDVTEEKRSEAALRESEARLQKALSIETVGVLFFTLDGRITDANDTFLRLSGYSREELRNLTHWRDLTPPEFWDVTSIASGELATLGNTAPYEKQHIRKDGSRWWGLFSPTRLKGSGRSAECVEFVIDISDRKRLEEERKQTEAANTADFINSLSRSGEMGKVVRSMDWSKTPLGPIESWPQSLRTTVSLCLASNFPVNIIWGPGRVQIYNDGYWPLCGDKHPRSMGQDYKECWLSAWDAIGEPCERATAGETAFLENQRMFLDRNGYLEETFFTFSLSPIRDETGSVGGLFHPVTEMTQQILAERRLKVLRDLADRTADAKTIEEACGLITQALAAHELDLPFTLFYRLDPVGKQADLVSMTGLEPGSAVCPRAVDLEVSPEWALAEVTRFSRGEAAPTAMADQRASEQIRQVNHLEQRFGAFQCSPYPETPQSAIVMPIALPGLAHLWGVFIGGVSPRRALDEAYQTFYTLLGKAVTTVITNAHAYEEERKRAESLAELDRAKTAFFSNVSHEFRTPLTLSLAPLQDALSDRTHPLDPVHRERLELVHRNSLRLLKLVNTLLDFSRIEAGRMEAVYAPTDLATYTTELASVFRSAIERAGLQLIVDCPPLSEPVFVDREMWEKIVLNLLSNAFKFTFEGEIRVSLYSTDSNQVILQIQDTGTGIAPEHLPHLFERFYQVRGIQARTHEGSGIGLALVNELVRLQGGTIEVSSTLGEGTCFTIALAFGIDHLPSDRLHFEGDRCPVRTLASTAMGATAYVEEAERWLPEENGEASTPTPHSPLPTPPSARVLIVDDNADMREYLTRILSDHVQVEAVADGATALAAAQARVPDLILSDMMMPGLDGFELLEALRADSRTREVPIILLSARAGEEAIVEGLEAGADDYLVKPFSAQELISRVTAHLQIAQLRGEALQQERSMNRQKDEFISVVSHELNTPLVSILGWTRLLRSSPPNPVMLSKALDTIERNATLQGKLVQDLLDLSRITAGKLRLNPQPIELKPVIETAIATLSQTATDKGIDLTWQDAVTKSVVVVGDSDRLQQVICNLLSNAIKFTPEPGSVRVELSVEERVREYEGEISPDSLRSHFPILPYAQITITDTGIGIAADFFPHVFERFRQAEGAHSAKGLGLGLAITRHIVELHNGTIYAESAGAGQGTSFIVRLPLLQNRNDLI